MLLFSFWLIRLLCVIGIGINLVFIDIHDFASLIFTVLSLLAAFDLYIWGLYGRENYDDLPSLFILFRAIQFGIFLVTDSIMCLYMVVYAGFDALVFILYIVDRRWCDFILKPAGETNIKTKIDKSLLRSNIREKTDKK